MTHVHFPNDTSRPLALHPILSWTFAVPNAFKLLPGRVYGLIRLVVVSDLVPSISTFIERASHFGTEACFSSLHATGLAAV